MIFDPLPSIPSLVGGGFALAFGLMFFAWGITAIFRYFFRLLGL